MRRVRARGRRPACRRAVAVGGHTDLQTVRCRSGRHLLVGLSCSGHCGDTWVFDGSSWSAVSSPPAPSGRYFASMVFDPVSRRVALFGGYGQL
jgi:hypothetical protein